MSTKWRLIILLFLSGSCQAQKSEPMINTETVKNVDLEKYAGTWYEIARFPHSFEKDHVGVTATYTLKKNGKIEVLSKGYKSTLEGKLQTAKGKAKVPDPDDYPFLNFLYKPGANVLLVNPGSIDCGGLTGC